MPTPPGLAAALALCLPAAAVLAAAPAVKPGLWEVSREAPTTAQTPIPEDVLARFPPDARARFEAAQHAHTEQGGVHSTRECITQGSLEDFLKDDDHTKSCTRTVTAESANSMELHLECRNLGPGGAGSTGTFKWTLPTPESMHGTLDLMTIIGPRSMSFHAALSARWLGPDCGDVKPRASAK